MTDAEKRALNQAMQTLELRADDVEFNQYDTKFAAELRASADTILKMLLADVKFGK